MLGENIPQSNSLISEILLFISGGLNLAVSLGWSYQAYNLQFRYCWLIGVVIGAFLAAPALNFSRSRHVLQFACILVLIGGVVNVSDYNDVTALIAARYLNGIGIGLTTVEYIVRGSEIAAPEYRTFCLSWEQFALYGGAFLQMLYTALWSSDVNFSSDCVRGIFSIIFAVLAMITSYFHIESPIYYLRKGDEDAALNGVKHLFLPHGGMTEAKQITFNELRNYVADSESRPLGMSMVQAHPPMLKMVFYRAMLAFISALPLNVALLTTSALILPNMYVNWPPIVYGILGVAGVGFGASLYSCFGCKLVSLFSLLIVGACTIAIGAIFDTLHVDGLHQQSLAVFVLLMIAQFFGGFFAPSTTIYLGEAFPLHSKSYFVAICVIVQYLVDLIIVCTFTLSTYEIFAFCVAVGVIMCILCLHFLATIPGTRNTTLLDAERRFAIWKNHRSY